MAEEFRSPDFDDLLQAFSADDSPSPLSDLETGDDDLTPDPPKNMTGTTANNVDGPLSVEDEKYPNLDGFPDTKSTDILDENQGNSKNCTANTILNNCEKGATKLNCEKKCIKNQSESIKDEEVDAPVNSPKVAPLIIKLSETKLSIKKKARKSLRRSKVNNVADKNVGSANTPKVPAVVKTNCSNSQIKDVDHSDHPVTKIASKKPTKLLQQKEIQIECEREKIPSNELNEALYQLSTGVLPPFLPGTRPPEKYKYFIPGDGFRCNECGDTFFLLNSLTAHLERRSISIWYNCKSCRKTLVFYNRCNLLRHVREHTGNSEISNIKDVTVTPIPNSLLNVGQPLPLTTEDPINLYTTTLTACTSAIDGRLTSLGNNSPVVISNSSVNPCNVKASELLSNNEENPITQSACKKIVQASLPKSNNATFKCPECRKSFETASLLEDHFTFLQKKENDLEGEACAEKFPQCGKCGLYCPSNCFLSAHQRLHSKSQPFVCPECGQRVANSWDVFRHHLLIVCLHYSRRLKVKCPSCSRVFAGCDLLLRHCVSVHGECYFKCQTCPMAFKSEGAFVMHQETMHNGQNLIPVAIHKCPLCDLVFQSSDMLRSHLDEHLKSQERPVKYVFKCPECGSLHSTKSVLRNHMSVSHPALLKRVLCPICGQSFDSVEQSNDHQKQHHHPYSDNNNAEPDKVGPTFTAVNSFDKSESGKVSIIKATAVSVDCKRCGRAFNSERGFSVHKQHCFDVSNECLLCKEQFQEKSEMQVHARKHLDDGHLVCTLCNSPVFSTRNGLVLHLNNHVTGMQFPAACEGCGEMVENAAIAIRHLKIEHRVGVHICTICNAAYTRRRGLLNHQRTAHKQVDSDKDNCNSHTNNNNNNNNKPKYACWLCSDRIFSSSNLLIKHFVTKHKTPAEEVDVSKIVPRFPESNSVEEDNQGKNMDVDNAPIKRENSPVIDDENSHTKKQCVETLAGSNDGASNQLKFKCAKCDLVTTDQQTFLAHIVVHKEDRESCQCGLCGLCFLVEPSLRRHLLVVHKVKDADRYMECNAADNPSPADADGAPHFGDWGVGSSITVNLNATNAESSDGLQCSVCYRNFDTDILLKTHMRTHGMAFIRSKRLVNQPNNQVEST